MWLFFPLKAFHKALEDENKNGSLPISSHGAKSSCPPHSSVHPQGKAVNNSCLPGLHLHSVLTQTVTKCFYLRHMTPLWLSKPCRLLWRAPCHSSWGKMGDLAAVLLIAGSLLGQQSPACMWFVVYGTATPSWKTTPGLADCIWLPCSDNWELCHTQAPSFFLWPLGSWDHTVSPRIPTRFATWALFKQGCPSLEQTSKNSDFVLCCCITFW